jgi:sugar lactone lactonase YvrE
LVEEQDQKLTATPNTCPSGTCINGVLEIPQTLSLLPNNPTTSANFNSVPANEKSLANVAPAALANTSGVWADAAGNLYVSDKIAGIYLIPNPSGTPDTAGTIELTPLTGQGSVVVNANHAMFVPTTVAQSNGEADVATVNFEYGEFGGLAVGTASATPLPISFVFNGAVTPGNAVIVEAGAKTPDFAITGGSCVAGTAVVAGSSCTEQVAMTPTAVGSVSAKLLLLNPTSNVISSITLHGTGLGSNVISLPGIESTIGSTLSQPSQIAIDAAGNIYVADSGLKQVLMYAAGSSSTSTPVSLGTNLADPTGVAVDGGGDVFIADSGNIYEIPFGPSGLVATGQITVTSGLGANLNIAADSLGNVYVADPANARVVKIGNPGNGTTPTVGQWETFFTSGFTSPSAVAVDSNNNLYVIDGTKLIEYSGGAWTTPITNLTGATGLAVDPSGAVYITSKTTTERIPLISGVLDQTKEVSIASDVADNSAVAIDRMGNVYLAPAAGSGLTLVSTNGTLNFGSVALGAIPSLDVINTGNSTLSVTGYTSSNSMDYTGADGTCIGDSPLAAGGTCQVDITLSPGPGEQGTLTSVIGITSNAVNSSVIDVTGVSAPLADSVTTATVSSSAEVVNTPITVTVKASSGTATPTGIVTVTFTTWIVKLLPYPPPPGVTPVPTPVAQSTTATGTLSNGTVTISLAPVMAGPSTFTVAYGGDRVFGRSTVSVTATVAKSAIVGFSGDPNPPPYLPYVLETDGSTPYDGSVNFWEYNWPVTVNTALGIPTGTLTFNDNSSTCPTGTSAAGVGITTCELTGLSGIACPASAGAAVLQINNSGAKPSGAGASFNTSCLPMLLNATFTPVVSTHAITPVYSGDVNFLGVTWTPETFQVLRSPMLQITTSAASSSTVAPTLSVAAGSTASIKLILTSLLGYGYAGEGGQLNNYDLPVSLACTALPPHATCSFTYPNPDPNTSTAVDIPCAAAQGTVNQTGADDCSQGLATMTIHTNIAVGTTSQIATTASVTFAAIFGFGMIGLFFRRKAFDKSRMLLMVCLMVVGGALAGSLTACSTTNLSANPVLSTPSGTYAVTVTAQQVGTVCVPSTGQSNNCNVGVAESSWAAPYNGQAVEGSQNQVSLPFYVNVTVQ